MMPSNVSQDPVAQMNTSRSLVSMIVDLSAKDEIKLKAAQELAEDLEIIISHPQYPQFLEHAIKTFLKLLQEQEPQFIAEHNVQALRKSVLEIIHRLPTNDHLKPYVKGILQLMFKLLEIENEENVLVCLRIIIELHKQYRPAFSPEIQHFLQFVKKIYQELPGHLNKIFEPRPPLVVKDISEININAVLLETFTVTAIQTDKKKNDNTNITFNVIPKAELSLKVLAELPIIVVLMYQLYKHSVHQDVADFIPLIMGTISQQPPLQYRQSPYFNKEVFVDFMAAQIKTLSFLAYIVRIYQDIVNAHSTKLAKGMLGLLILCPPEVAHLRKELLIAARHILATDLRDKFVGCLDQFFDENILIGSGWTAYDSLRPLAYSTLADLVHHVRTQIPLKELSAAVTLFSRNVHDDSLPTSIQTMSCKLLLNLVECIRTKDPLNGRDLLMRMLEVFVLKFKTIAKLQLPILMQKSKVTENSAAKSSNSLTSGGGLLDSKDEKATKFGFPSGSSSPYTVTDCKGLVKTLVCGVKTITWGIASCKVAAASTEASAAVGAPAAALVQNKQFQAKETLVFIRLVKYALQALDVYTLMPQQGPAGQQPQRPPTTAQPVRSKDEKEVLEHFAGVFQMMNPLTFKEVFSTTIEYVVERIHKNYSLQIVANSFLANSTTSPIFATILVEYLLARMEEMGHNVDRSNLYLKLFKLVFGSVSLFPAENEQMLKPNLHLIVNRAMGLALTAKEPYNYFLLLRALFRSIGGGSHDQLYQEFLPLLPSLLQGLNSLQSGLHKQHMKDLFVELCLTVPVRLSSLLPYLPLLMDPLVSALNGSQTLVSQGLRTLELCVDNLQPDFLYDHISPVRAELMHALWKTLRNPTDNVAHVAFRVLGKFGGGNRKMMVEPQKLEYNLKVTPGPCLTIFFEEHKNPIILPTDLIIETAMGGLKNSSTDIFYKRQCWEVIKGFIIAHMQLDDSQALYRLFTHYSFTSCDLFEGNTLLYKSSNEETRSVMIKALTGMLLGAATKELHALPFVACIVRHCVAIAISQQVSSSAGGLGLATPASFQSLDSLVLIEALATVLSHEDKDLCRPALFAMSLILDTAATILGGFRRVTHLTYLEQLSEKLCGLCYERAWYAKLGGCIAIKFLFERMPLEWVLRHQYPFLRALFFVMMDLTGEVSSGAIDMAKSNLEKLLTLCATSLPPNEDPALLEVQRKSLHEVTHDLVRQITSPNTTVREQAMSSLRLLAKVSKESVTAIMEPHKDVLADMIPPRKHLLRHQPVTAQIGVMDGNTFCTSLEPRLFTFDLNINEHKTFFNEIMTIGEMDDAALQRISCYKHLTNLLPLRQSALRALAACHYLTSRISNIFDVLLKALHSGSSELQEVAFECLQKFLSKATVDMEQARRTMKPLLQTLADYRSVCLSVVRRLSHLTRLFPTSFNERLCDQLQAHLSKWLEVYVKTKQRSSEELQTCLTILQIFHQIPAATSKFVEPLINLVLRTEKLLSMEAGSPFREPLIQFLQQFPSHTVDFLLSEPTTEQLGRFLLFIMKDAKQGACFREHLQKSPHRLVEMVSGGRDNQFLAVSLIHALVRHNDQWLASQPQLAECLRALWVSDDFQQRHTRGVDSVDYTRWREPKLLAKCLLSYFRHHPNEIELLFQLLRAFTGRFLPDFEFLRNFLENTVALNYTVEWKRKAFFRFVDFFHDQSFPQDLKAKILQFLIIPLFASAFERGEGEKLIGGPPTPEQDPPDNVISVFINKIIDPENPFGTSDFVRILLLQFSCLLVEQASPHIHDAANKRQGYKLRRLTAFAWPCLLPKLCVDPATKYHGHLLLAHIIAKFAIHKRIVLQVFHSLLKAHAVEARGVVRQALEVLTPAMPARMEDGNTLLTHWTKKIIVEEGHTLAQLVHMLQLLVRHYRVYYPVRHHLIGHMVNSVQRLGFTQNAQMEHKRLAVDLAEVIIRWEQQRAKEEQEAGNIMLSSSSSSSSMLELGEPSTSQTVKRARNPSGASIKSSTDINKPIEKAHSEAIVNFLLRMACQVNEATPGSPGESLSRRCVGLLKLALGVWPDTELRLAWFDKLLGTVETQQPNYANVCTALELLTYLVGSLRKEVVLASFRPLQRGIAVCMTCQNNKVIRSVHALMSTLMATFPVDATSGITCKYEELESLYASVSKVVFDGFQSYEKNANLNCLFGPLMVLKAACVHNPCSIDRLITIFMRVLQKMTKEHISPTPQPTSHQGGQATADSAATTSPSLNVDLLILSLDLVKNRVGVMGQEMRKSFIGSILVGLIEKSPEVRIVKAITKMVEDWVKNKSPFAQNMCPTMREKSILLVKMMQFIEKRFPDELELNALFLEIVNYVYRDETLKSSEIQAKLEPAFMAGLRCVQPHIRAKFFEVFDGSMKRRLHERLMYITVSQNWESVGPHFWIQQCIELVLATAARGVPVQTTSESPRLPSLASLLQPTSTDTCTIKEEPLDIAEDPKEEEEELERLEELANSLNGTTTSPNESHLTAKLQKRSYDDIPLSTKLQKMALRQGRQLDRLREYQTVFFLNSTAQLAHWDTSLAQWLWIQMFPRLWKILNDKQQTALAAEIIPFISSGSHVIQKETHPSALGTFVEALCHCSPSVPIKTAVLRYLGKSHNLWHRVCLLLENLALERAMGPQVKSKHTSEVFTAADVDVNMPSSALMAASSQQEAFDTLADMYSILKEEDLFVGLWQKRAKFPETITALAYEQQGCFEHALQVYEQAVAKIRNEQLALPGAVVSRALMESEYHLVEEHWIRVNKELGEWNIVIQYSQSDFTQYPHHVLDSAWRDGNWAVMATALADVENNAPKEWAWKLSLYHGYLALCGPQEEGARKDGDHHRGLVDRYVEIATNLCIREWRRYPPIVSNMHTTILQAAQQIMELQEAAQIHQGFLPPATPSGTAAPGTTTRTSNALHDMKAIVKTWRNRLPVLSDDLSHWSDILAWRQHHYKAIINFYENHAQDNSAMMGVHASAQSIIHFGKIARKQGLPNVCLEHLNRIHTILSVPIIDCFQKISQQVKCYLHGYPHVGKAELQDGLDIIESTNLKYFTKDMSAEFYALKGLFYMMLGQSEDANKAFSAATQLHDTLVKAWALWGDYNEALFTQDRWSARQISLGVNTIVCFLHACRHQLETKSRKHLAKVLWLLTYDDEKSSLAEAVEKYHVGVPPSHWLPWVPQLLTCLVRPLEGKPLLSLISQVGRVFPQAVYFPIRTLYLTLKIEQRERFKASAASSATPSPASSDGSTTPQPQSSEAGGGGASAASTATNIKATPSMWRCSRIMQLQRDFHPTILSSLEGIVDQMVWFRENWYEEVLRQLRQGLAKCYAVSFENRMAVADTTVTPHTLNFVKKLVSTFGVGIENVSSISTPFASAASESLARRAQATAQDPVFQKMKVQFTQDFDFSTPGSMRLQNLILKLKKWIKILEAKTKMLPSSFLIEERCRFLSNFTQQTADIEMPGEFLMPKASSLAHHNNYHLKIARFMPRVEIVQKHNTAARRLYIRGHNGKICPYLIVNDACLRNPRREERVLQFLRMANHCLGKQKETARRHLHFTTPRVVAVSPQMRLIEDNPASISLLDIYKAEITKRGLEPDAPILRYYERLAGVQARGSQASHQVLRDILKDVQSIMVGKDLVRDWAVHTYPDPTCYWTFRRQLGLQLALAGLVEYALHFTRLNPDMMYIHQDSGLLNVAYFRFDLDDVTGELDSNRPVPFRLTPNLSDLLTPMGVSGPFTGAMIAAARCLVQPNFKVNALLRAILRDELITWHKKRQDDQQGAQGNADMEGELLVSMVTKAVAAISQRLQNLASFENGESKVATLVAAANSHDNLCRMDPAWHPWL